MRARTWITVTGVLACAVAGSGGTAAVTSHHHPPAAPVRTDAQVTSQGETAFLTAVLKDLGDPVTGPNLTSLAGWVQQETPWPPVAANNPFDSELNEPGATVFNSDGVRNYPSPTEGAAATAATISNGFYPHITAALAQGTGVCNVPGAATDFLTWSNQFYSGPAGCPPPS